MKGPPPTPVEIKKATGNPGKRPLPEVIQVGGRSLVALEAPKRLTVEQREVWDEVVPTLATAGLLDHVDVVFLEGLSVCVARAREASKIIEIEGMFTKTSKGQLVVHPAVRVERDMWAQALKLGEHYGLTPVARTRLGLALLQGKSLAQELNDKLGEL